MGGRKDFSENARDTLGEAEISRVSLFYRMVKRGFESDPVPHSLDNPAACGDLNPRVETPQPGLSLQMTSLPLLKSCELLPLDPKQVFWRKHYIGVIGGKAWSPEMPFASPTVLG